MKKELFYCSYFEKKITIFVLEHFYRDIENIYKFQQFRSVIHCISPYFVIKVYEDGTLEYGTSAEIVDGEPINDFSCVCPLSTSARRKRSVPDKTVQAEGFVISISNGNGSANFSEESTVLTFNSACYECNTTSYECIEKVRFYIYFPTLYQVKKYIHIHLPGNCIFSFTLILIILIV